RSAANVLGALAIAIAVAGCFESGATSVGIGEQKSVAAAGEPREDPAERALPDWVRSDQPILRYQLDVVRDRLWVLTPEGVELYDAATRGKIAHISLPDWLWAGEPYSCAPDLALGPRGEALVSSNVVPKLWRIDPVSRSV